MRGPSTWTIGERELMAALVAKWNSCAFCLGAHRAIAAKQLPAVVVSGALSEFRAAPISTGFKTTLAFLEKMTMRPTDLTAEDAHSVLRAGVTRDALGFAIPTTGDFDRAGDILLKRGYE